ncbi:hypothetical protein ACJBUE_24715 (plasmid) [Ralstonia syzygii subsp. celebesensis]|uniref:hypothetical protein n=1 Tax=Ralstonia syzygii TaxID=28097 RepID=UPI00387E06E3
MESKDIEICRGIGQILYDAAPAGVSQVLMKAELAPEGDACKFEYDYSKENGESGWFLPEDGMVDQRLRELLVLHRDFLFRKINRHGRCFLINWMLRKGNFHSNFLTIERHPGHESEPVACVRPSGNGRRQASKILWAK